MGYAVLRQIRSKPFRCRVPSGAKHITSECSGSRNYDFEDYRDYCAGWSRKESFFGSCNMSEFHFSSSDELQTYSYTGKMGTYSGGGYVILLSGLQSDILKRLKRLQELKWIDKYTRAIMLEFSVYNLNVNLFGICVLLNEFMEGGGVIPSWRVDALPLIKGNTFGDYIVYGSEVIFVIITVLNSLNQFWKIRKEKCKYFSNYWNICELVIISLSYVAIALYINRTVLAYGALDLFEKTYGNGYIRMDSAVKSDMFYLYSLSFIVFLSTIKLIKLLEFNRLFNTLSFTIMRCWSDLSGFLIVLFIVFFSFTSLFYFMFCKNLPEFVGIIRALQTNFTMMLGKFNFQRMTDINVLFPILFFTFSVINTIVLINLLLSIIMDAFTSVKVDLDKIGNKHNILEYMVNEVKCFMNLKSRVIYTIQRKSDDLNKKQDIETSYLLLEEKVSSLIYVVISGISDLIVETSI